MLDVRMFETVERDDCRALAGRGTLVLVHTVSDYLVQR